jgi:hypothetical protein
MPSANREPGCAAEPCLRSSVVRKERATGTQRARPAQTERDLLGRGVEGLRGPDTASASRNQNLKIGLTLLTSSRSILIVFTALYICPGAGASFWLHLPRLPSLHAAVPSVFASTTTNTPHPTTFLSRPSPLLSLSTSGGACLSFVCPRLPHIRHLYLHALAPSPLLRLRPPRPY